MADQTQFKHIKVNAQDDDVVIVVGKPTPAIEQADSSSVQQTEAVEEPKAAVVTDGPLVDDVPVADKKSVDLQDKPPAVENAGNPSYSPTTLEDIKSSKMPLAQIITIVLAVVLLCSMLVWYLFFR